VKPDKTGIAIYLPVKIGSLSTFRGQFQFTEAVASEPLTSGITKVTATISTNGKMQLLVNQKIAAIADARCVLAQPGDGLQLGDDKIKPVGDYTTKAFSGSISELRLQLK
jgi:hypothetical protein